MIITIKKERVDIGGKDAIAFSISRSGVACLTAVRSSGELFEGEFSCAIPTSVSSDTLEKQPDRSPQYRTHVEPCVTDNYLTN